LSESFDAVIIGSGISGLGAGALLGKAGKKVLVLEKSKMIGGRAASFEYRGYILNIGTHAGFVGGKFDRLLSRAGKNPPERACFEDRGVYDFEKHGYISSLEMVPAGNPEMLALVDAVKKAGGEGLEKYDAMSAKEFLSPIVSDRALWQLVAWCGTILTCIPRMEDLAASSLIDAIKQLFRNPDAWLAAYGIGDVCHVLAEAVRDCGGEVRTGIKAQKILTEGNRVAGVVTETDRESVDGVIGEVSRIKAPIVITAFPVWDLFDLIEESHFPREFVQKARDQDRRSANMGLMAGLEEPLFPEKVFVMADLPRAGFMGIVLMSSNVVPTVAPKGEHLLEYVGIGDHSIGRDREHLQRVIQLMKEDLEEMYPGWEKKAIWVRPYFHWVDPARRPGYEGVFRIGPRAPGVEGLYFTGDSVCSRVAPGMECAADSAMITVKEIVGE